MYHLMNLLNKRDNAQLVITTHSSFVANRMDLSNIAVLHKDEYGIVKSKRLIMDLEKDDYKYFFKSTDYATLRLILCKAAILVEGPTDEMVCHYYMRKIGREVFHNGIELMAVDGVSFKHFIALAKDLKIKVAIIRDRDKGTIEDYNRLYFGEEPLEDMKVFLDKDQPSIEQSFVYINEKELQKLSDTVRCKKIKDDTPEKLIEFMVNNKTEWAYRLLEGDESLDVPQHIKDAFNWLDGK